MAGDDDPTVAVVHHDLLALEDDLEPGLSQRPDRFLMDDPGDARYHEEATSTSRTSCETI